MRGTRGAGRNAGGEARTADAVLNPCSCAVFLAGGCRSDTSDRNAPSQARTSILLVTLDTTRADAIGPEAKGVDTPAFNALAARGKRFRHAYATVPETLPSHSSMMTGLYPAGHGVHENARYPGGHPPCRRRAPQRRGISDRCLRLFFVLAKPFGLGAASTCSTISCLRGSPSGGSKETTDRALAVLVSAVGSAAADVGALLRPSRALRAARAIRQPYAESPTWVKSRPWTQQLGRLVQAFEQQAAGPAAIIVVADHGEGLGDHGEAQHGTLLYQPTMRVPLVIVGPGVAPGSSDTPVSNRRIYNTLLDLAGVASTGSLRGERGGRACRGHEAVPQLRMAAADHGRLGAAKGDLCQNHGGLRHCRGSL